MSAVSMSGGEAVVKALIDHQVDTVFGIPGIQLDPLFDAFYAHRNQVRMVHTRHEQGAAFMAMGYAQASGRSGVFAAVPGPGLLNAMAAVSTAVTANTPVLALTGQIPSYQIGQGLGMAHELRDQLAMSEGVVDWACRMNHPSEVPDRVREAFRIMHGPRNKPVVLEMAPDQYAARAPVGDTAPVPAGGRPAPDPQRVAVMAKKLADAKAPVIFVGGGALDASAPLRRLAERLQAPVIASVNGRGALADDHPLSQHILAGQGIWEHVDVALVVGTRFTAPAMSWGREREVTVLRIDSDPVQIVKPRPAEVALLADASAGIEALLAALGEGSVDRGEFLARCGEARQAMDAKLEALGPLPAYSRALRAVLPRDGILVTDVTQLAYYTRHVMPVYEPRTLLAPGYQATLGYGLPAALGAKLACPQRQVVSICGDGGFMFAVQELATAVQHRIAVVVVVLDNSSYGNVKTIQDESFGGRNIAVDLTNPDFVALAKAFGMPAERVTGPEAFQSCLQRMLKLDEPALIHVPIDEVPSIWPLVKRPPAQGKVGG